MPQANIAGFDVDVDEQGFMTDPKQWNRQIAEEIAADVGISPLTADHWTVIEFCRADTEAQGKVPGLRRITKQTGVKTKKLYGLFPRGPGKLAAKVSGLTKPNSCV
jgi:tRNA 2-thiouridine synthesizing protein E